MEVHHLGMNVLGVKAGMRASRRSGLVPHRLQTESVGEVGQCLLVNQKRKIG